MKINKKLKSAKNEKPCDSSRDFFMFFIYFGIGFWRSIFKFSIILIMTSEFRTSFLFLDLQLDHQLLTRNKSINKKKKEKQKLDSVKEIQHVFWNWSRFLKSVFSRNCCLKIEMQSKQRGRCVYFKEILFQEIFENLRVAGITRYCKEAINFRNFYVYFYLTFPWQFISIF